MTSLLSRALADVRPRRATIKQDAVAAVPNAIASVPDGMASAILVGVNPIYGLYASFVGPIAGGLTASTRLMVITATTAAALAAGSAVAPFSEERRPAALFMLSLLAGAVMIAAGILRLGRYTRFVSFSVMIGFLSGVAVNIVCGQLSDLLGASASGRVAIEKAFDILRHPSQIDPASAVVGVFAIVLLVVLARTRLRPVSSLVAIVLPTLLALVFDTVAKVEDAGGIPTGIPLPHLPDFALAFNPRVLVGALAVSVVVLVQGVGVAESAPNADGRPSSPNRDFIAQGIGNVASGLFRGQPVGGSVGSTALNRAAGGRTQWAAILSGFWLLAILLVFAGIVGKVALPTLAAVLIVAAVGSLRSGAIRTILRTGRTSQIAFVTTFASTLLLPVAAAVGIGVALSLLLQLNQDAMDLRVVRLVPLPEGGLAETKAPMAVADRAVTLLDVYGSLYYAGARTLAARLPEVAGAVRPAVVVRLRGRTALGSTGLEVLAQYAQRLHGVGGRLFLSGLSPQLLEQITHSRRFADDAKVEVFPAEETLGSATTSAYHAAVAWLADAEVPSEPV